MGEQATRLEALDALLRAAIALRRHVEEVGARYELSGPQARLVIALSSPQRMQEAAEATACEPSHLTAVAAQLEHAGMVVREPDPDDRRARNLVLTEEGRRLRRRLVPALIADAPVISGLDPGDCAALTELLRSWESWD